MSSVVLPVPGGAMTAISLKASSAPASPETLKARSFPPSVIRRLSATACAGQPDTVLKAARSPAVARTSRSATASTLSSGARPSRSMSRCTAASRAFGSDLQFLSCRWRHECLKCPPFGIALPCPQHLNGEMFIVRVDQFAVRLAHPDAIRLVPALLATKGPIISRSARRSRGDVGGDADI